MKTAYFEGAGWSDCDTSKKTDLTNCRIRGRFTDKEGRAIYLELGAGYKVIEGISKAHIDHCFYDDCNESSNIRIYERRSNFQYTKNGLLDFLNNSLGCDYEKIEVINDGSYRVHGDNGTYNIYFNKEA